MPWASATSTSQMTQVSNVDTPDIQHMTAKQVAISAKVATCRYSLIAMHAKDLSWTCKVCLNAWSLSFQSSMLDNREAIAVLQHVSWTLYFKHSTWHTCVHFHTHATKCAAKPTSTAPGRHYYVKGLPMFLLLDTQARAPQHAQAWTRWSHGSEPKPPRKLGVLHTTQRNPLAWRSLQKHGQCKLWLKLLCVTKLRSWCMARKETTIKLLHKMLSLALTGQPSELWRHVKMAAVNSECKISTLAA